MNTEGVQERCEGRAAPKTLSSKTPLKATQGDNQPIMLRQEKQTEENGAEVR